CGEKYSNGQCNNNHCCSGSGYCGTTNAFCSIADGCQKSYGVCTEDGNGITCTEVRKTLNMMNDGIDKFRCEENEHERCGKDYQNQSCTNQDDCCSADGYCGTSKEFCYSSNGCQAGFGICKCGEKYSNGQCNNNHCCSSSGYCGTTNAFCSIANGCQKSYGIC
ncbi:carbohydrate-binding module family 18 protein, partial [Piromyces sp. E2]